MTAAFDAPLRRVVTIGWLRELLMVGGERGAGQPALRSFRVSEVPEQYATLDSAGPAEPLVPANAGHELADAGVTIIHLDWDASPGSAALPQQLAFKLFTFEAIAARYFKWGWGGGAGPPDREKLKGPLGSHRAECVFYRQLAPELRRNGVQVPEALHCSFGEDHFQIGMTCDPTRAVRDRLEHPELRAALSVAAKLHTLFWRHGDALGARAGLVTDIGQTGAFWAQDKQDLPTDDHLKSTWGRFVDLFGPALEGAVGEGTSMEHIATIGKRVAAAHAAVTQHLHDSKERTLLHGDLKAANMMWPVAGADAAGRLALDQPAPLLIDWEWVGMGVAAQDVAYLLASSGRSSCLTDGGDRELVTHYWSQLSDEVRAAYPLTDMHRDYELCLLDLFRWMLSKAWVTITPEKVAEMASWYGRILPNRSMPNLVWIVTKVDAILRTNPVVMAPG